MFESSSLAIFQVNSIYPLSTREAELVEALAVQDNWDSVDFMRLGALRGTSVMKQSM